MRGATAVISALASLPAVTVVGKRSVEWEPLPLVPDCDREFPDDSYRIRVAMWWADRGGARR